VQQTHIVYTVNFKNRLQFMYCKTTIFQAIAMNVQMWFTKSFHLLTLFKCFYSSNFRRLHFGYFWSLLFLRAVKSTVWKWLRCIFFHYVKCQHCVRTQCFTNSNFWASQKLPANKWSNQFWHCCNLIYYMRVWSSKSGMPMRNQSLLLAA